ncbi:hypothetical protein [Streptomyces reniochalinae]|uniref:VIT family protein n=1 Tax=Streptomyces reniochalinae TaxID=2250578 RepID=A0A367EKT8_9ACTN|nr:hypothetical protein [Streptomyces reniochalinae]RCG18708.1 hypothetical protein DQ392_12320 [Streptomyces reniochalinae]
MTPSPGEAIQRVRLPVVLGLTDGLLNALTLAAGSLAGSGTPVGWGLAGRVGGAALVTAAFTVMVADYAERRAHLVHVSRELSLSESGRMAATRLGRLALLRSYAAALAACVSSFVGAALPLALGAVFPGPSWIVLALAILALSVLGATLARFLAGQPAIWALAMAVGGVATTWIGIRLRIA